MNDMFRRAEMRWMSVEDADITVSARELAEFGHSHSALLTEVATLRDENEAMEKTLASVEAVCAEYDHASLECEGECCVDRKTVTADFRAALDSAGATPREEGTDG